MLEEHEMRMFWINLFLVLCDPNLNPQLDRNINSPPIAYFRFINEIQEREMGM